MVPIRISEVSYKASYSPFLNVEVLALKLYQRQLSLFYFANPYVDQLCFFC